MEGLTGDHLVQLADEGISPAYIRTLKKMNLKGINGDMVVELAQEGTSPDLLREMAELI